MRRWIGEKLRRWADRIDYKGAPKSAGLTFTFERGRGAVLHGELGVTSTDRKGCLLWYLGDDEYEKAWTDAEDRPPRVLWENINEGRRPFVECPPSRFARGGVIQGPSDPSDDSITFKLSDGHGWVRPMTVEAFGEEGLKRLLGVDHPSEPE